MTTRVDSTGVFLIPTNSPMNGVSLATSDVGDYDSVIELVGGAAIPTMAGLLVLYPAAETFYSVNAVAFRTGGGWEIYLTAAGVKVTTDASMSEGSIVIEEVDVPLGLATLYESTGVAIPAFWTNFKNTAEDEFGGSGG